MELALRLSLIKVRGRNAIWSWICDAIFASLCANVRDRLLDHLCVLGDAYGTPFTCWKSWTWLRIMDRTMYGKLEPGPSYQPYRITVKKGLPPGCKFQPITSKPSLHGYFFIHIFLLFYIPSLTSSMIFNPWSYSGFGSLLHLFISPTLFECYFFIDDVSEIQMRDCTDVCCFSSGLGRKVDLFTNKILARIQIVLNI